MTAAIRMCHSYVCWHFIVSWYHIIIQQRISNWMQPSRTNAGTQVYIITNSNLKTAKKEALSFISVLKVNSFIITCTLLNIITRSAEIESNWNKKNKKTKPQTHNNTGFLDVFPESVIRLPVFTPFSSSRPGPVTRHLVLSAERPVPLVSKISHQQEPLCGKRQKEADRRPELSHYGLQTAEDNRNRLKLCWTLAFEWGYWTLKALLAMKKPLST